MNADLTQADVVVELLATATGQAVIVAPFITRAAFQRLLSAVPDGVDVRCYTRWLPSEVASQVSDPNIIDDVLSRDATSLWLVDRLHAKLYVADAAALVGSVNVTGRALGTHYRPNLELLVNAPSNDPAIMRLRKTLVTEARQATRQLADDVIAAADLLPVPLPHGRPPGQTFVPVSPRAQAAYSVYSGDRTVRGLAELEQDLYQLDIGPGLDRRAFIAAVRTALASNPIIVEAESLPPGKSLFLEHVKPSLESLAPEGYDGDDLWKALLSWIDEFASDLVTVPQGQLVIQRGRKP